MSAGNGRATVDPQAIAAQLRVVQLKDRQLREVTFDSLRALELTNDPPRLFVRGGALARVRRDEQGRPLIDRVGERELAGYLARAADLRRGKKAADRMPPAVVADVLALGEWPFPSLEGIIQAPALRPDGTVIHAPGYDQAARVVHMPAPGFTMLAVPETPARSDVDAAVELVDEALEGFPFVDDASRANAIAFMLTPSLRPAIAGQVPLALSDAPTRGTGKGLLIRLASIVSTGSDAAMMPPPKTEEEWAKVLLSLLSAGQTFIVFDEAAELRSAALASALTAAVFQGRVLGLSEMAAVPQRATWSATGNNVRLGGDLGRRSYWIRMDPKVARPWERKGFRHPDLLDWALSERPALLRALLVIARSWFAAGQPPAPTTPTFGGFSEWTRTLAGVLAHAGIDGFLGNLPELYEQVDHDSAAWETFLLAWHELHGDTPVKAAQLAADVCAADTKAGTAEGPLREVLPESLVPALEKPASLSTKLGRALGKRVGTRHGDTAVRVEKAGQDSRSSAHAWCVVVDEQFAGSQGSQGQSSPPRAQAGARAREATATDPANPAPLHGAENAA